MKRSYSLFLTGLTIVILLDFFSNQTVSAQNVGINNPTPNAKALLDLTSSDKGLLAPRMTAAQRIAMFPISEPASEGMLVYQTDGVEGFYYYDGAQWSMLSNDKSGWSLTGNAGTSPATNFLGTTDNQPMIFKTNNTEKVRINTNGNVGIGTAAPSAKLEVRDSTWLIPMRVRNMLNNGYSVTQYYSTTNMGGHVGQVNPGAVNHANNFIVGSFTNSPVSITTNDLERIRVTPTGLVGIGTPTPQGFLDINNNSWTGFGHLALTEPEQDYSRLMFRNTATTRSWEIAAMPHAVDSLMALNFYSSTGGDLMTLKGNGRLGFGTFNPRSKFHLFTGASGMQPNTASTLTIESNQSVYQNILSPAETGVLFGSSGNPQNGGIVYNTGGLVNGMAIRTGGNNTRIAITETGNVTIANGVIWNGYKLGVISSQPTAMIGVQNQDAAGLSGTGYHTSTGAPAGITGWANDSYNITPGSLVHGTVSNNPLTFITNTTERMRITSSGNVGIGLNNPTVKLEVQDPALGIFAKFQGTNNAGYSLMHIMRSDNVGAHVGFFNPGIGGPLAGHFVMGTFGNAPLTLTSNNVERLTILPDGRVGIGMTAPAFQFEVQGGFPASTMMRIKNTDASGWSGLVMDNNAGLHRAMFGIGNTGSAFFSNIVYAGSATAVPFALYANNAERIRILTTGEVGVGTATPTAELEVNGYTKLGTDAPAVKMKKLTATTATAQGTSVSLPHGLNVNKILSVSVLVDYNAGNCVPPSYTASANYEYNYFISATAVSVYNILGNSSLILGKPVRVLITYEE
jgi:hypothetical protein